MRYLKEWDLVERTRDRVVLNAGDRRVTIFVADEMMMRVLVQRPDRLRPARTWSIDPSRDMPVDGRDRLSMDGFECSEFSLEEGANGIAIATASMRLEIERPFRMRWLVRQNDQWKEIAADRPTGGVAVSRHGEGVAHYLLREQNECFYGLGDKGGDLNRAGRRFDLRTLDAMGYEADRTDPLYKHVPFTITRRPDGIAYGVFYDNLSEGSMDLGCELDNYHKPYRSYRATDGDLDLWVMLGPQVVDVVKRYTWLTGGVAFGPKWSLGYSGSTMHYTDAPNAQEQLGEFVEQCANHRIPCDSFQLSSGYSSIGDKRYVFTWNRSKVPDPEGMVRQFADAGVRLIANIKPCLLTDHPLYESAAEKGLFVVDSDTGTPEISPFWDAEGSHLDFTNPAAFDWWRSNVTKQLLEKGIGSTWNDNNEFEITDGDAKLAGFGSEMYASVSRPVLSLLMVRASYEAQLSHDPAKRPFLITRSGGPGLQRYAQTWSGDNRTSWQSLKYNIKQGLSMALSGCSNVGHDVGGFSGPRPGPELFVRWVQNGVMHPRFTIHSWNDDGTVNEPWMYPQVLDEIRDAMALRYQLLPYLYTVLWKAHTQLEPMIRPTFLDHEKDQQTFVENDEFLLGEDLLVASVVEEGATVRTLHLPDNGSGWYAYEGGRHLGCGKFITVDAPLSKLPLFVRAGTVLPTSDRVAHVDQAADNVRALRIYPFAAEGARDIQIFEDDGESFSEASGEALTITVSLRCTSERIDIDWRTSGGYRPAYDNLGIDMPTEESRPLYVQGNRVSAGQSVALFQAGSA